MTAAQDRSTNITIMTLLFLFLHVDATCSLFSAFDMMYVWQMNEIGHLLYAFSHSFHGLQLLFVQSPHMEGWQA